MEYRFDDVNPILCEGISPQILPPSSVVFYAERRHPLEILPEFLASLALTLTVIAVITYLGAWFSLVGLAALPLILLFFVPFVIEVFRWQRDVMILTQYDLKQVFYSIRALRQDSRSYGFIAEAQVTQPTIYKMMGFDIGNLQMTSTKESKVTPLVPKPNTLLTRIRMAERYREPEKEKNEWREA